MQFAHFEKSGRRKRRPSFALLYLLLPLPGAPKRRIKEGAFHPDKRPGPFATKTAGTLSFTLDFRLA